MASVILKAGDAGNEKSFSSSISAPPDDSTAAPEYNPDKPTEKSDRYLDVPLQSAFSSTSHPNSHLSLYSADNENERRAGRLLVPSGTLRYSSRSPGPRPTTWKGKLDVFWSKNKGLVLVVLSQLFGVIMNVTTRLLETDGSDGPGMHPFQILFARMIGTVLISFVYQWLTKVEHAPFGPPEVRMLLIIRGIGGFFGVYGMYYSLQYLPLADATVITFLSPIVACWACSILIHEPFTRNEQVTAVISFLGVVLIARPASLVPSHDDLPITGSGTGDVVPLTNSTTTLALQGMNHVTSAQRLGAVGFALLGVLGAACAFTTIRWIGKRAHPLISVNYFSVWTALVSTVALLAMPDVGFRLPSSLRQWTFLISLGICGFLMQFLLTAGLASEKSSRATNMVYTQMLFALAFDKLVWGTVPGTLSIIGSSLILGSALYLAVQNSKKMDEKRKDTTLAEDVELTAGEADDDDDDNNDNTNNVDRRVPDPQSRPLRI